MGKTWKWKARKKVACSRLRDSRAPAIEKTRTKTGGNFFPHPAPIFARPSLSRLPHYLRAWNRLVKKGRVEKKERGKSFLSFIFLFAHSQFRGPHYLGAWNRLMLLQWSTSFNFLMFPGGLISWVLLLECVMKLLFARRLLEEIMLY